MTKKLFIVLAGVLILGGLTFAGIKLVQAEQSSGSLESGVTSYIKTIYTSLVTLNQGSDAAGSWGDWGGYWNRIHAVTSYLPASMVNQVYHDSYGAPVTETTNYSLTWTTNPTPVTGDDNKAGRGGLDPRTGLTWSMLLLRTGTTVGFASTTNTPFSWGATHANNIGITAPVAGNRTAIQLCADQGNGWRLPTQKELMQAYIDGSYWNLTQPSNFFWSVTEVSASNAWDVYLTTGNTNNNTKTSTYQVRCVR